MRDKSLGIHFFFQYLYIRYIYTFITNIVFDVWLHFVYLTILLLQKKLQIASKNTLLFSCLQIEQNGIDIIFI